MLVKVRQVKLWANSAALQALLHAAGRNIIRFRIPRYRPFLVLILHAQNPNAQTERDQLKLRRGSETNFSGKPRVFFAPGVVIWGTLEVALKRTFNGPKK